MKPILSEFQDNESLCALGRASVQIVHDLKNQLNGLKLYATFLRKRLEKSERPADELETVNKLIGGLDRTAADLSMIVQYGQPLALRKQPGIDLHRIMGEIVTSLGNGPRASGALVGPIVLNSDAGPLVGEFDSAILAEALKSISVSAMKMITSKEREESLQIHLTGEAVEHRRVGVIKWRVFDSSDHDPFHSFAGSDAIRISLAAKVIEAHGGSAKRESGSLCVRLPLG
jgi:nitrogen fixation/metabolism regulation signal transduction histidine kinase